ncbi:hypothetical protein MLD38_012175 [Melastoma candidum]|uniref:Uncharacterized protein n=1 Tax=Melastoma candidum TaxID=119954 RepID=A0ACB9R4X0_9MYRT|nr:hypothetical protein MLD38_012175 [Melastoma candidum]
MKIQIHDTALLRPSSTPFTASHTLQLSYIDSDPNLNTSFRYVRVYPSSYGAGDVASRDPYVVISTALSSALVHYYPFTGSLRSASRGDRLELHCAADGGLPLIQATADCSLYSVDYLDGADPGFVDGLAPDPDPVQMRGNPCWLQVTTFKCGGFCLGAAIHHAMCDGAGGTQFFIAVAEMARGAGRVSVEPVWGREVLLRPREPARDDAGVGGYLCERGYVSYEDGNRGGEMAREYLEVREEWVEKLKAWMMEKCGSKFTTFEALGAFIWRAKVKVSGIPEDEQVKFAYSADIRKRLEPPLPAGYWGNGCVPIYAQQTAQNLLCEPIWSTAELIRKSKGNICNAYARSYIDFQMMNQGEVVVSAGKHISGFTDWRHLGHSAVDFGWGGPVNVVPLSRQILGSTEACFFLPLCSIGGEEKGRFRVLVNMKRSCVDEFKEEIAKLSRMDFEASRL